MAPNVLLHGVGAIGAIYLHLLLKAGCRVTAVCRSNYDAVKANGFTIDSVLYNTKDVHVKATDVVRSPSEAAAHGPFDFLVVTTKALPDAKTAAAIAPAVTDGKTCIVLIQNGVGIEDEYVARFPGNPLLSCAVYLPSTQISPGRIQMGNQELLEFGTFPDTAYDDSAAVKAAADSWLEITKKGGSNCVFQPNIQVQRWKKLMLNASWNPICALTLSRDVAFYLATDVAEHVVLEVMLEIVHVAQALGFSEITPEMTEKQIGNARKRIPGPGIEPSMLVDVLNGRRMEVEAIVGHPVREAKRLGVSVPRLETLYALAKALDDAIAFRKPGQSLSGDYKRV
ncbi:hypothetical protein BAUCODRAFT_21996 [Baudoinia panamericana UAMH 10762]|uniref:2-dehydropantoate 2-reductase n=1 Tax=Baudoinia panamericana (strain UAMH 10762) TaxID=717646 RepID=M2NHT3_BAUPA|nr:uncharacterized protein BAUCODRAFT_21996 [Baudoinia panamericana UAMH 10762]EMC98615.1 hypothetical protein BAUCODRAFT_21996 [Baudoinia panamericana UAMH 10762]